MKKQKPELDLALPEALTARGGRPLIIAGPCSAETEEQVLQTAQEISNIPEVTVFRAGIWKPRTRPNNFEGVGIEGLRWLKRVKEETGLLIAVEVANARHAYEALKYGIDILWIGARTTVNPFSVQEIANAIQGSEVTVWVKNPINPELPLWIGALERLSRAGIKQLGAIHRGFSTYDKIPYRNIPKWDIPIELKRQIPELPLICDPSHIAGKRDYLHSIAQKALDLAMDGLMIESHIQPENALSDAAQQLSPAELQALLEQMRFRKMEKENVEHEHLELMRHEIDLLDHKLLEIVSSRIDIAEKIGSYKKDNNLTIFQVKRWEQLLEDRVGYAHSIGLKENFVKEICQVLHKLSIKVQEEIMNEARTRQKETASGAP